MSDISMTPVRTGGAVADVTFKVGGGIRLGGVKVSGGVDIGGGGSAPVTEARWGSIEGNISAQTDLMAALDAKADATALDDKLTTPSGTDGQFMRLVNGTWTAADLPTYEGGVE